MGVDRAETSAIHEEVHSQPDCWLRAAALAEQAHLPPAGASVALVGCGTSLFAGQAIAAWREAAGHGWTDAFSASEMPLERDYDHVVVISRSGTTTEVLRIARALSGRRTVAITAGEGGPLAGLAEQTVELPFADERAVVQTRFCTTVLALWRAHLGHDVGPLADAARARLTAPLPSELHSREQFVFLGRGGGVGLANEAALKLREAAQAWTEAYPAMELRHGPITLLGEHSLVWSLGELPDCLGEEITGSGARLEASGGDCMVELVRVHRAAIALAEAKGLDPDRPPRLERSVVLE